MAQELLPTIRLTRFVVFMASLTEVIAKDYEEICGGVLTTPAGSFSPPQHRASAEIEFKKKQCLWIIKGANDKMIKLELSDMQIIDFPFCEMDKIVVEDANRRLGIYCGYSKSVQVITTETGQMFVLADYSTLTEHYSFNATYELVDVPKKRCGGLLNSTTGWLTSMDFDQNGWYDSGQSCIWKIEADRHNLIVLHFLSMDIRGKVPCQEGDYVELQDGYSQARRLCGSLLPPVTVSRSNIIKFRFQTDYNEQGEGFNLTYTQVTASSILRGGFMNQSTGIIVYPTTEDGTVTWSDPSSLVTSLDIDVDILIETHGDIEECLWILGAVEDKIIQLHTTSLEFGGHGDCHNTTVVVYDEQGIIESLCGTTNGSVSTILSRSNIMFMRLVFSEGKLPRLNVSYDQIYDTRRECSGFLNNSRGLIASPDGAVECFWVIQAGKGMTVVIDVISIAIEETSPCKDYLLIYDVKSSKEKVCGFNYVKSPFHSTSDILFVRYVSGSGDNLFSARYNQVPALNRTCGGVVNASSAIIQSLDNDFDGGYDYNLDCVWEVKGQEKMYIFLEFTWFVLEVSENCKYDYLEIYEEGEQKVRQCAFVNDIISKSTEIFIHFVSDGSGIARGFRLNFRMINESEATCNREMNATSGWIAPHKVDAFKYVSAVTECTYLLHAEQGYVIMFYPFQIDLQWTWGCGFEYLQIDGSTRLCGNQLLPRFMSKTNQVVVQFGLFSETRNPSDKFNITYFSVKGAQTVFSRILEETTGEINLPITSSDVSLVPKHHHNLDYTWIVQAKPGNVIIYIIELAKFHEIAILASNDKMTVMEPHNTLGEYKSLMYKNVVHSTESNIMRVRVTTDEWLVPSSIPMLKDGSESTGMEVKVATVHIRSKYFILPETELCDDVYRCLMSNITIQQSQVCDAVRDCPYLDDERFCTVRCAKNCSCVGLTMDCTGRTKCKYNLYSDSFFDALGVVIGLPHRRIDTCNNPQTYLDLVNSRTIQTAHHVEVLNISRCMVKTFATRFFYDLVLLEVLDISYNKLKHLPSNLFLFQNNLKFLFLDGNSEMLNIDSGAFTGLSALKRLSLFDLNIEKLGSYAFAKLTLETLEIASSSIKKIEERAFGDLQVTILLLNGTSIESFSDLVFDTAENVNSIFTDSYKFCCIRPYYLPAEKCYPQTPVFSTCFDLLGNSKARGFIWIVGLVSVLSNLASVKQRYTLKVRHHFLMFNLAFSDLLMGSFVLIIIGSDVSLRGNYAPIEVEWRSSVWYLLTGILSQLSIVCSPVFVGIVALSRLLVILFPTGHNRFSDAWFTRTAMLVWTNAFVLSAFPILYSMYVSKIIYSHSGVLLTLALRRDTSFLWYCLVSILGITLSLTLFMVGYGFWKVKEKLHEIEISTDRPRYMRKEDLQVSRNILVLVLVDTVSLLTIYMLGVFGLGESYIDDDTYAWITFITMAVMSAMNPLMFNFLSIFEATKLSPSEEEQRRPLLVTGEEFDQILALMFDPQRRYWWKSTRKRGYFSLRMLLKRGHIDTETCVRVAHGLAWLIERMHARHVVQEGLRASDVVVKKPLAGRGIKVALFLRGTFELSSSELQENMESYGHLMAQLIQRCDDCQKIENENEADEMAENENEADEMAENDNDAGGNHHENLPI